MQGNSHWYNWILPIQALDLDGTLYSLCRITENAKRIVTKNMDGPAIATGNTFVKDLFMLQADLSDQAFLLSGQFGITYNIGHHYGGYLLHNS